MIINKDNTFRKIYTFVRNRMLPLDNSEQWDDKYPSEGSYRIRDDMSNLKVKIKIKAKRSSTKEDSNLTLTTLLEETGEDYDSKNKDFWIEKMFSWQQKVFSKSEVKKYSESKSDDFVGQDKVLERKFFHDVSKISDQLSYLKKFGGLYTYIDGEMINDEESVLRPIPLVRKGVDATEDEPNYLTSLIADGIRRRLHGEKRSGIPTSNIVINNPSRLTLTRLHSIDASSSVTMSIRFNFEKDQEVELLNLKLVSDSILKVSPDFSYDNKPYKLKIGTKCIYEYLIENASETMNYEDQIKESLMLDEVLGAQTSRLKSEVGSHFELPGENEQIFRLVVNGEIVKASSFEYDGLFVRFLIQTSSEWTYDEIDGVTQVSLANSIGVSHFGHLFSADLKLNINVIDKSDGIQWPKLFIQVLSIDSWTRFRVEGYGFTELPRLPGSYSVDIETWRPLKPNTPWIGELRRYFVGGTPEIDNKTLLGNSNGRVRSRYGLNSVSSGTVRVKFDVIHHSPTVFGNKKKKKSHRNHLMDRIASASLLSSVESVIEAFGRARQRIREAKAGLEETEYAAEK